MPMPHSAVQPTSRAAHQPLDVLVIGLILTSGLFSTPLLRASDPPPNLARLVAERETETEKERSQYTYRQSVTIDELDENGRTRGQYREVRDVIFSPEHERTERMLGQPSNTMKNLILTPEDFEDVRNIQPLVFTLDRLFNYETRFKGEEVVDEVDCWVLQV